MRNLMLADQLEHFCRDKPLCKHVRPRVHGHTRIPLAVGDVEHGRSVQKRPRFTLIHDSQR